MCLSTQIGCLVFMVQILMEEVDWSVQVVNSHQPNHMATHGCYGPVVRRLQELEEHRRIGWEDSGS